ncbi:putative xylogalacturonan beta-1,3-xylosyltransferase [Helianthus annuus]|uniref:Putative exostosin-like protein n=1 Tax=Helianthus annuus TaxID=4232 RepID=A0A251VBN3_HELAN|nr:probable glycosyltransferase At5g03795 [Helianthus annuus]XP_022029713.1 probable glycosyltransferase At5g03795 [Helianthus annuus]XP_022029715.1 probable glycosyltransferase At5g03795 [Helianthus annuus]KAF5816268.1 putative xylogalacturonan beta-1,3-xylosyltransferase [Helianthus annuus]
MNKIAHSVIVFLIFKIHWKTLLPIGVFITITFALFQLKTLPYQLTTPNSLHPDTNQFDINLKSQITPLTTNEESEVIKIDPETDITNSSSQLVPSIAVVQEKVKVTETRNQVKVPSIQFINKPNKSLLPLSFSSASERRRKRYLRDIKGLSPYEALVYAKKELDTISVGVNYHDPNLYVPLFRNITVFERSYELMELILKVYVYQDGKRPVFHNPYLRGIYSSEGWFMKFMESSKEFVTRDPQKAHLFYLPYSARQLQRALYVPNSHNIKPLSIFLRDYVNKIASKYPFWNRTRGSDHFLVACHDWGPYTLKDHKELTKNTIKALCNADTSEGVFVAGKDVSLPETTIGNPRRPLRNMGGRKISQRPILAFFAGGMHGRVRPTLLKYWANKDKNMIVSGPMSYKTMSYSRHMKSSKYCICPMGFEVNSPRIVEAIYYECVPVIIADNFVPPLNEVLNWSAFSVSVAEQDIPKLKEILEAIPMKRYRMMQNNVKMLQRHFYWNRTPVKYDMFHMILHSIWLSRLNQIQDLTGTQ